MWSDFTLILDPILQVQTRVLITHLLLLLDFGCETNLKEIMARNLLMWSHMDLGPPLKGSLSFLTAVAAFLGVSMCKTEGFLVSFDSIKD